MIFNTGYCFTSTDIFSTFDKTKIKIRKQLCEDKYGCNKKQRLCETVFIYCWYLILLDIIENNITFVLPLFNNRTASVYAKPVTGEKFKRARQNGAYADIDILASNFTGYQLTYSWKTTKGTYREKPIYITKRFKDIFYKKINEGKQYY